MEKVDQELLEMLKQDCRRVFMYVSKGLIEQAPLIRPLPGIRLGFSRSPEVKARIGYMPGKDKTVLVTISEHFLMEIYESITTHVKIISSMMRVGMDDHVDDAKYDIYQVMEAIYELSLQFVLHHELFHLLSGHLDLQKGDMRLANINESDEVSDAKESSTEQDKLHFYFHEVEADGSSIIWIINKLALGEVNKILVQCDLVDKGFDDAIIGLDGRAKVFAYKMLFIALWLVISLIERARGFEKENGDTHPLPATRIIAFIHTLLEHYAELTESAILEDGRFATLDEDNIPRIREFQEGITLPFSIFFREFPDASKVDTELKDIDDFDLTNSVMSLVKESSNIFVNGVAETVAGSQIKSIETVRIEMTDLLYAYRYLEEEII